MRHYPCMRLEAIEAMPVSQIAARQALLLMWTTVPFLMLSDRVVRAWGFRYKSSVVWTKEGIGTGHWARNRHEVLLICTRGGFPCPKPALFPESVIVAPRREHSRKPDAVHGIVDARLGHLRRLEMFARASRPGWTTWGNENTKFDQPGDAV